MNQVNSIKFFLKLISKILFLTEINLLKQSAALSDLRFDSFQFPWIFLMFYKEHKAINRSISSAHCFIAHKTVPSHLHVICISAYRFAHRVRPGIFSWNEERWFLFSVLIRLSKGIRDDRDHAARPCTSHPLQWMGASDEESESFLLAQFSVHHSWIWASQNKGKRQPKKNDGGRFYLNFFSSQFFQRGGLLFFFFHNSRVNGNWPSAIQVTGGQYKRTAGEFHESIGHAIHFSSETTKNLLNDWTQKKIFSFLKKKKKINGQIELWDFIVQRIWFSEMIYFNDRSFQVI